MMNGFNNNFNSYQNGYYGGMVYNEPQKLTMTQGLNPEQLKALRKTGGFSLDIPEEEMLRSFCTHRYENKFAVSKDDEGAYTCSLCGTKFKPFEGDVSDARDLVDRVVDLLETTKMQSLTLSPKVIQDFFQIEPVLKRLPDLYSQSRHDYQRALGFNNGYTYGQENNAFMMYQNMINPVAGNYYDPAIMQGAMYNNQMGFNGNGGFPQGNQMGFNGNGGFPQGNMGFNGNGGFPQGNQMGFNGNGNYDMNTYNNQQNPFNSQQQQTQVTTNNTESDKVTVTKQMQD